MKGIFGLFRCVGWLLWLTASANPTTWVGTSAEHGPVNIAAGEVLILKGNVPVTGVTNPQVRWQPQGRGAVLGSLAQSADRYAFAGPGVLEFLNPTLTVLHRVEAADTTTVLINPGATVEITAAAGECLRFYRFVTAVSTTGSRIGVRFSVYDAGIAAFRRFDGFESLLLKIPGPIRVQLELASGSVEPGSVGMVTYQRLPLFSVVTPGTRVFPLSPNLGVAALQSSSDLQEWTTWLQVDVPTEADQIFLRMRLE